MKKRVITTLFLLTLIGQATIANENIVPSSYRGYSDYPMEVSEYYTNGVKFLKSNQFTNAIDEFRKALRENPADKSSKIQLVNAYILRAQYYNNTAKDYNRAANDLRSSIFYLKYYDNSPVDAQHINNLNTMEHNLENILYAINADQTPKGRFTMGKSLRAQGEFAAAVVEFQKAQQDTNYRKSSLANIGEIYDILNIPELAVNYLEQAISMGAANSNLHLKLANSYEKLGQIDKAAEQYNFALSDSTDNQDILTALENIWKQKIDKNPNDAEAHANLGAVYQKKNNFKEALTQYEKAEALNPSNVTTRLNIGTLYQAKKEYETAIAAYDTIIEVNPNHLQAYLYKAQCYKELGNKDAALQNYKLALNLDPSNQALKDEVYSMYEKTMTQDEKLDYLKRQVEKNETNPVVTYKYAYENHKLGNLSDAIKYYQLTIKLDEKNQDAYINLAQAYQQQKDLAQAKNILTKAKDLFPQNTLIPKQIASINAEMTSTLYAQASELFNKKRFKEAIELYQKITPATAESLLSIGACYQSLDDNTNAAQFYEKSFEMDTKNSDTAYYTALAYSNIENFEKAKLFAKKALEINSKNQNAQELLAYVIEQENTEIMDKALEHIDKEEYKEALTLLNKAIEQDDSDANAYYYRAMIYDIQKDYNRAIIDYKKALTHNPQILIANYSIAVAYDNLSQFANALFYHKKYLSETQKVGETNDYTRYSARRIQDLKKYEPTTTPAGTKTTATTTQPAVKR